MAVPPASDSPWWSGLPAALRSPEAAAQLRAGYVEHGAADDLVDRSPEALDAAVASHVDAGRRRPPGTAVVRLAEGRTCGAPDRRTTVEVVAQDMPFLVESLTAALTHAGRGLASVAHPRLAARRDASGELLDLHPADVATPADQVESWIRLELDEPVEPAARPELTAQLEAVLADVRAAVRDWSAMRERTLEAAAELERLADGDPSSDEERRTAAQFLRWLAEDRFTFLGYREYDQQRAGDGTVTLVPRPGTGLGLLAGIGEDGRSDSPLAGAVPSLAATRVLRITKARVRSTVHRAAHLDDVSVQRCDATGRVVGERRLLGLFTSSAANESVRRVPVIAQKVAQVLRASGFAPGGHSARDLLSLLEQFPRDELLQADVEHLLPTALGVLQLQERRRTRLFVRCDDAGGFVSCLVFLPRDRWSTAVGTKVEQLLRDALDAGSAEHTASVSESALARLHVVVRPRPGEDLADPQERHAELETAVAQAVRSWDDDVLDAARTALGADAGTALVRRWSRGIPGGYRIDVPAARAVDDLRRLDALLDAEGPDAGDGDAGQAPAPVLSLREAADAPRTWRLSLYRRSPVTLSSVLPVLSALGVEVTDERPHLLQRSDGGSAWLYDVGLRLPDDVEVPGTGAESVELRTRFGEAFAAAWSGRAESDALDRLVLSAQLGWRQVALLRALVHYLRQTGLPYSLEYVAATLLRHPGLAAQLVRLFQARFDPRLPDREATVAAVLEKLQPRLDAVDGLDADRILRALLSVVQAALRTNAYARGPGGEPLEHLSVKLDPSQVAGLPQPVPRFEVWVYSPRVEGVHLRFGAVARGGLRWSDRREDFRTEVLGLVKAQVVKNAVIVPTGAKGGFVGKRLPDPAVDRDAWWTEGTACYATFVSGLLDVTDDLRTDGTRRVVVPPADVVRYDGDDPYLVVAADKGTATFSDLANSIARDRGFWLGDAFASGGSNGYDHKAMGITARGAWESVRRHFRELGVDPEHDEVTAVGIGDMSGDVFGNGMLLSRSLRLVAAFDHRHVFLDPDPDPAVSFEERRRLFALPRSSWADYDPALLSPGGGVHLRSAKAVPVSPQVAVRLGLPEGTRSLSPEALVQAVLRAPVDLLWNGGVGTYVKASSESHAAVGDRANDAVRVDGAQLRVRVVAEGGNLGLTQRGRVEAARAGVRLNNDAVDNSAGVDCSDHEVNIKILLDRLVHGGELSQDERNATLRRMTDDVARLVLRHNYEQNTTLSVESALASNLLPAHRRFVESLEAAGTLDRTLEALPSTAELHARAREGTGLTVPELAVLLAHAKISLGDALLLSDLPDEPWVRATLRDYFPRELVERLGDRLDEHPLRREIATTVLVNRVVGSGGITFAFRAGEETGSEPADVVRAWAVATRVFGLEERAAAAEALDGRLPAAVQARLRQQSQRLLDRAVRWFLHERPEGIDVEREVERFAPVVAELAPQVPDLLLGQDLAALQALAGRLTADGVDEAEARRTAGLLFAFPLLDVTEVAVTTGRPVAEVATTWFVLDDRYGFDRLLTEVSSLSRMDRWEALARAALRDDLYAVLREFTTAVLETAPADRGDGPGAGALTAVAAWEDRYAPAVRRARQTLDDLAAAGRTDLTALSVALRTLRTVVRRR